MVAYIIRKNRASPSPIGHHSLRQERPFTHWSVLITRQLSVTQQRPIRLQYSTCGTFWNNENKKRNEKRRMMMNREISQSDDLARKTNRKWEELPSLIWNLFFWIFFCFFCSLFLSFLSVCVSRTSVVFLSFPTADFSAMRHGTIDR